jgi:hypothetical protein
MLLEELPVALRSQAVILAGEPAWPSAGACAVVEFMRERGVAVLGVELWLAESGRPRVLGWSSYRVEFTGDWRKYVDENAGHALADLAGDAPEGALFNLTWIDEDERSSIEAQRAAPPRKAEQDSRDTD